MSKFFINRPIFATVLALLIIVAGLATMASLPIAQYPNITPPTIQVTALYPGASASTIAETVAAPIEQQVNGVEGMLYMNSVSSSSGVYTLTVTFDVGTDIDMATVLVQNRVSVAMSSLPQDVTRLGVTTKKVSTDLIQMISIKSSNPDHDALFLSNFAKLNLTDELTRLNGVGSVTLFGADDYSMRLWLKPEVLKMRNLTPMDIYQALRAQNMQVSAGKVGAPPVNQNESFQYTLDVQGRLITESEFGNTIIKNNNGQILRLRDVATIELGGKTYNLVSKQQGRPMSAVAVYQLPGANALEVADEVRAKMTDLQRYFPKGLEYEIVLDTTVFVEASIEEVYKTLFEAIILVLIVIMLFLQNWRAVVIPTLTIPVSLIGTFAVMGLLGFSINTLTLFGLILAIGIVVDDAIIVVENTYRLLETGKYTPKEATTEAMEEVTGPIIGTVLVLLAVFIPTAFIGGMTGELYKQFALTIAVSTFFSGLNALTLSPALCALLLKKEEKKKKEFIVFKWFNQGFGKATNLFVKIVSLFLRRSGLAFAIFGVLSVVGMVGFLKWPSSFLPPEDQGYFIAAIQLPEGASLSRTEEISKQVSVILDSLPGIETYVTIDGNSILDGSQSSNGATVFVTLKHWNERTTPETSLNGILAAFHSKVYKIQEAIIFGFSPPVISGLGESGGLEFILQDRSGAGFMELQKTLEDMRDHASAYPQLASANSSFKASVPQLFLNIDRDKVTFLKLSIEDVFSTLSMYMGSAYINDFVKFGKTYQVKLQAFSQERAKPEDLLKLSVRNTEGQMVPFSAFTTIENRLGTELIKRYNMYPSATLTVNTAPGYSSGEGIEATEKLAADVFGNSFGYEWTSMAYQEKKASSSTALIFGLAIIVVLLVLAAQYESWTSPMAVVMGLPIAILGTVLGCMAIGQPITTYTQIGVVLLIALSAKNAILIVEFGRDFRKSGKGITRSCLEAGEVRFRPILMTSFAFILGVAPLVTATGAGAGSRVSLGIAVFAGMIATAFVTTLFIPNFFKFWEEIQVKYFDKKKIEDEDKDNPFKKHDKKD